MCDGSDHRSSLCFLDSLPGDDDCTDIRLKTAQSGLISHWLNHSRRGTEGTLVEMRLPIKRCHSRRIVARYNSPPPVGCQGQNSKQEHHATLGPSVHSMQGGSTCEEALRLTIQQARSLDVGNKRPLTVAMGARNPIVKAIQHAHCSPGVHISCRCNASYFWPITPPLGASQSSG